MRILFTLDEKLNLLIRMMIWKTKNESEMANGSAWGILNVSAYKNYFEMSHQKNNFVRFYIEFMEP